MTKAEIDMKTEEIKATLLIDLQTLCVFVKGDTCKEDVEEVLSTYAFHPFLKQIVPQKDQALKFVIKRNYYFDTLGHQPSLEIRDIMLLESLSEVVLEALEIYDSDLVHGVRSKIIEGVG